jgi:hypothetical protein
MPALRLCLERNVNDLAVASSAVLEACAVLFARTSHSRALASYRSEDSVTQGNAGQSPSS